MELELACVALPLGFSCALFQLTENICILFAGHLDDQSMISAMGLAFTFTNVICQAAILGFNNWLGTIVGIAFGQKNFYRCELVLMRYRIMNLVLFVPLTALMLQCGRFYRLINVDDELVEHVESINLVNIVTMVFVGQFECYRQYLASTQRSYVVLWSVLVTVPLHIALCYFITFSLEYKHLGPPIAFGLTWMANLAIVMIYAKFFAPPQLRVNFLLLSRELYSWAQIKDDLSNSLKILASYYAEHWPYELWIIFSTQDSIVALSAQTIAQNVFYLLTNLSWGVSQGTASCLAIALGEESEFRAKSFIRLGLCTNVGCQLLVSILLFTYPEGITTLYTSDTLVQGALNPTLKVVAFALLIDSVVRPASRCFYVLKFQVALIIVIIVGNWLVMIPIAMYLTVSLKVGPQGNFFGYIGGQLTILAFYFFLWRQVNLKQKIQEEVIRKSLTISPEIREQ